MASTEQMMALAWMVSSPASQTYPQRLKVTEELVGLVGWGVPEGQGGDPHNLERQHGEAKDTGVGAELGAEWQDHDGWVARSPTASHTLVRGHGSQQDAFAVEEVCLQEV